MTLLSTWQPRCSLPTDAGMPPAVAEAMGTFARLHRERDAAQQASGRAAQAVRDGEVHASAALADALLTGGAEPRRTIATLEEKAKVAEARWQAYRVATDRAHVLLAGAVAEHAGVWSEATTTAYLAAQARLATAVAEVHAAAADLTTTGSLLAMLSTAPTSLVAGHYKPEAYLSSAGEALDAAVAAVAEHAPVADVEPEVGVEPDAEPAADEPETAVA